MACHADLDDVESASGGCRRIESLGWRRLHIGDSETHFVEALLCAVLENFLRTENISKGQDHEIDGPHRSQGDEKLPEAAYPPQEGTEKKADHGPKEQKDEDQLIKCHAPSPAADAYSPKSAQ